MKNSYLTTSYIRDVVSRALAEDLGTNGDITSASIFGEDDRAQAVIRAKQDGVIAGTFLLRPIFKQVDARVRVSNVLNDGSRVKPGDQVCRISGPIRAILSGERIALNFLQRLSGVATATSLLCSRIAHTSATLLDTRKTTPGFRPLEKAAVVAGGGSNHRFGLFDMILIKDTHVKAAGGVGPALELALRARKSRKVRVEVEVQSVAECQDALRYAPDIIMLDNMSLRDMRRCVALTRATAQDTKLEASGNVSETTIRKISETGVDFISVGAITHSAPALDLHLLILD